jgi:hypothetical protein
VVIENNNIHDCTLGTWLDWQAQGTRLTKNLYFCNGRDLFIEVTHGPCLIDHNFLLSHLNLQDAAQGTAIVHNVLAGNTKQYKVLDRQTPYHFPHSTDVLGVAQIFGGDNRVLNNMMLGACPSRGHSWGALGGCYYHYYKPEYFYKKMAAHDFLMNDKQFQPMWFDGNAYGGYAAPFYAEEHPIFADGMAVEVSKENGEWVMTVTVPEHVAGASCEAVTTERLGAPVYTEEFYENPDGTPIDFTRDFLGNVRDGAVIPGPFARLSAGTQKFVVWKE